jgi:hypothetical protein
MERHDTMKRAARTLLGAGTFAAATLAITAGNASAQTTQCEGEVPTVCGHVFADTGSDDNTFQLGEGTPEVTVVLTDSKGTVVETTTSSLCTDGQSQPGCGYYSFFVNEPEPSGGNYLVCIQVDGQTTNCAEVDRQPQAAPVTGGVPGQTADFEVPSTEPPPPSEIWGVGTGTPGYWKNHPEAWPSAGITVGGITYLNVLKAPTGKYSIYDAIKLMGKVGGDKSLTIFASLISAKLNLTLENNPACVTSTIDKADAWMATHPAGSGVKASSPAWAEAEPWHTLMDDYNNGKLCAPHRD